MYGCSALGGRINEFERQVIGWYVLIGSCVNGKVMADRFSVNPPFCGRIRSRLRIRRHWMLPHEPPR